MSRITKLGLTGTPSKEYIAISKDVSLTRKVTSIGQGTSHDTTGLSILNVAGSSPGLYQVFMGSGEGLNFVVGDALYDEAAVPNKYLVIDISGDILTVFDSTGVGAGPDNSGSSFAAAKRYYNGSTPITDWESELDDTDLYRIGDDSVGECYNDAVFDESVTINGGSTVGLNSVTLTVADGEKHDGTAGTGARIVRTSSGALNIQTSYQTNISWLEIDLNGNGATEAVGQNSNNNTDIITNDHLIVHSVTGNTHENEVFNGNGSFTLHNSIIYDCARASSFSAATYVAVGTASNRNIKVFNTTVYNCGNPRDSASANARGISVGDDEAADEIKNCISVDTYVTNVSATASDFNLGVNSTSDYNLSSDDTADDRGSNSLINKTSSNQFVSTASGSEDLHLKSGSEAIGAGVDLGTTPDGVNIDIDGFDRNSAGGNWDIGADQFVATVSNISNALLAFFIDF